jgi:alkanesulfonate monooxygenase SsuD/methylene tetrahydromethanopterin reductase-like flavin-dependent oxidoreductase (luciferase family)
MAVPVGLNVWSGLVADAFPYLDQVVRSFDSLWFPDHVQYGSGRVADSWTMFAYALSRYPDKLCGHQVLCNSFRNPAQVAKMAATAQAISGGRVVLGIGAGWKEEEYRAYGWAFPSAAVRIAQLAEAIQIIKAMWTEQPASFQGQHYHIVDAYCEPQPSPLPPIMVGGAGEKHALRVVAQHGDWWNYVFQERSAYAHKQEVLKNHCRAVGRDYDTIKQVLSTHVLIGETEEAVRRMQERPDVRPVSNNGIAGTPEQITERLLEGIAQGAHRITVTFADSPRLEGTQLFIATVLPHISVFQDD